MSKIHEENWKDIKDYEGIYQVSNLGKLKSLDRIDCNGGYRKGKILSQGNDKDGYKLVGLAKDGVTKTNKVHRLVSLHFICNPDNKPQVNHINGCVFDNRVENLEWATNSENLIHSFKTLGRSSKGILNYGCTLTEKQVLNIFNEKGKLREISKKYKVDKQIVSRIKSGYTWSFLTGKKSRRKTKLCIQ